MIWLEFIILLAAILIGARMKGIGLGVMGMVGLAIYIFLFRMRPAEPPIDVMLIILSVVTTAAALQAAGGMDYLVRLAEKILRSKPSLIVLFGPLVTYLFAVFAGTAHITYSLLPIISEVSLKKRIRPERALSISVISSHLAITASPISAATAALLTIVGDQGVTLLDILKVCIPSTIAGTLAGVLVCWKKGKDLDKDPLFLEKMKDPEFAAHIMADAKTSNEPLKPGAKTSVLFFALAVLLIVLVGAVPSILPSFGEGVSNLAVDAAGRIKMAAVIELVMLAATAAIILFCKTDTTAVAKVSLFTAGGQAVVSIFGVVWMSATFMQTNTAIIESSLSNMVRSAPWTFAIALFLLSILLFSQAATTKALMPLGMTLGILPPHMVAMFPAANGDFVLPGYPTLLAAINFDRTGSTHIGKFLVNHSFMIPGLVGVGVSVAVGFLLAGILF
ncbi:anaerobic C4-dicarboxylate transporter DcuA [Chitinophaga terrae (ex Kim and Jung 2007)]|uniref:Anaerobic C4-dicarboxylate transporter DcuA n=1 Tax=Chitinophaga terrae (ex Kim and Jung 2007) TaxID=408074 RepID=A0A1H3YQF5_9BACT|nr:anaerobic C4-dicarboxylate transporter [Chitinophaga terrae (ex Kim and Jung 2007)]GEP88443.1 C4-dicarboxylate ABC transporter [Chitinophaga terrae (ex Kim and Jung 2007)]SEA13617.1 anaerobic C4-dicarboxylate transporter DcuA [Chitinophaga terrae (ex Kim and Jung 2007)]